MFIVYIIHKIYYNVYTVCLCNIKNKKRKKSDALLQLPEGGQLQCLDLFPQRQHALLQRYTAIISLCHTPGSTRGGDSNTDRQFDKTQLLYIT